MAVNSIIDLIEMAKNGDPVEAWAREVQLATTAWTDVVTYTFDETQEGVILGVGVDLENPEAFSVVDWRLVKGDVPIAGPSTSLMPRSECLRRPLNIWPIYCKKNTVIRLQAQSANATVTHFAWGRLSGARWMRIDESGQMCRLTGRVRDSRVMS